MHHWKLELVLLCVLGFGSFGCATIRSVTHISTWKGEAGEYIYIGYAENNDTSKLRRCAVNPDNTLTCYEEDQANRLLNADK